MILILMTMVKYKDVCKQDKNDFDIDNHGDEDDHDYVSKDEKYDENVEYDNFETRTKSFTYIIINNGFSQIWR